MLLATGRRHLSPHTALPLAPDFSSCKSRPLRCCPKRQDQWERPSGDRGIALLGDRKEQFGSFRPELAAHPTGDRVVDCHSRLGGMGGAIDGGSTDA